MNHDRLFKELLTVFFVEFVELFLPDVAAYIDTDSIEFLDKEVFTDVTEGETHEVDIAVKARFRGQETFFIVHVENQASAKPNFPRRMFIYFARLFEKFGFPIYPVVIFSYDEPQRPEPKSFKIEFPGKTVLDFNYTVIQLNRLPWRRFLKQANPVACALMAKMKMRPEDRPRAKLECLRLLATLKLDPARSKLIGGFVDRYLTLTSEENKKYERALAKLALPEREATMELVSSWEQNGIDKGIQLGTHEGQERIIVRMIKKRFGDVSPDIEKRLDALSSDELDTLGEDFLDFTSLTDLETWLAQRLPN